MLERAIALQCNCWSMPNQPATDGSDTSAWQTSTAGPRQKSEDFDAGRRLEGTCAASAKPLQSGSRNLRGNQPLLQDQRRLSFPCALSILRSTAVACLTSGMAMPQCNCLPSRRVATTPADFKMARCCDRLALEIPSPSCSSDAHRSPRVNNSIRCRRVGFAKALQIVA
jgi:hypothetical protein